MNSKMSGSKLKGFTLLELIVVIGIIGILSGMISLVVSGFQRDAKMESNNNKAQLIYTGFQNILLQCEINQDDSLFDIQDNTTNPLMKGDKPLKQVIMCFGISNSKVDDDIFLSMYWNDSTGGTAPIGRTTYTEWFPKLEEIILKEIDNSFEGTAVVYMDFENYLVDSVIYFDKNAKSVDELKDDLESDYTISDIEGYADEYVSANGSGVHFQMLNSNSKQKEFYKYEDTYLGAYPKYDNYEEDSAPSKA